MRHLLLIFISFSLMAASLSAQTDNSPTKAPPPPPISTPAPPPPPPPPPAPSVHEDIFRVVEVMPQFPFDESACGTGTKEQKMCAQQAMLNRIYSNIEYPTEARRNETTGMAVVSFIIEKDGTMSSPKLIRNPGDGIGEEALRVVQSMIDDNTTWKPGTQGGRAVRVLFNLPVKFAFD